MAGKHRKLSRLQSVRGRQTLTGLAIVAIIASSSTAYSMTMEKQESNVQVSPRTAPLAKAILPTSTPNTDANTEAFDVSQTTTLPTTDNNTTSASPQPKVESAPTKTTTKANIPKTAPKALPASPAAPKSKPKPAPIPTPKTKNNPSPVQRTPDPKCSSIGVAAKAEAACKEITERFEVSDVLGKAQREGNSTSCHPLGLAVDFMTTTAQGNLIADYILAHQTALGVSLIIWRQRINLGNGWKLMEDRGSPTENHMDHVHASFLPCTH